MLMNGVHALCLAESNPFGETRRFRPFVRSRKRVETGMNSIRVRRRIIHIVSDTPPYFIPNGANWILRLVGVAAVAARYILTS